MKKKFLTGLQGVVFYGVLSFTVGNAAVLLPENDGSCPDDTIPQLNNMTAHNIIDLKAVIQAGWDSDKYSFSPGNDGVVKITYSAPKKTSVKIDYICNGSAVYRKADDFAVENGSVEFPVTQDQSVHIGFWNWDTGDVPYDFDIQVEFTPENDTGAGEDQNSTTDNNTTENNTTQTIDDIVVYEDAEDGLIDGWKNISPYVGTITNIDMGGNRVIVLSGTTDTQKERASYQFGGNWNNTQDFIAKWDMQTDADYEIFYIVKTDDNPESTNYIGYVSKIPELSGYSFNPATGYWSDQAGNILYDWGRYVYTVVDEDIDGRTGSVFIDLVGRIVTQCE